MGGGGGGQNGSSTAIIIHHLGGKLQELRLPTKAGHVLSQNPNCFLCSSDSMQIDSPLPHMKEDEEFQLGQIYFLMPLRKSQLAPPLSLPELCALAIEASSLLGYYSSSKTAPLHNYLDKNNGVFMLSGPGSIEAAGMTSLRQLKVAGKLSDKFL
ncbi:hypothetical protein ACOSQ4_005552 [Xanthoceras sorbifolium]